MQVTGTITLEGFRRRQIFYVSSIIMSGMIGSVLAYVYLPSSLSIYSLAFLALLSIALAIGYWFFSVKPKLEAASTLTSLCENVVFVPRRHSFICYDNNIIYCYNYATSRYYAILVRNKKSVRSVSKWTPLDYYCVKYKGGELREENEVNTYIGSFESLTANPNEILIGEGMVLVSKELGRLLEKVNNLGEDA